MQQISDFDLRESDLASIPSLLGYGKESYNIHYNYGNYGNYYNYSNYICSTCQCKCEKGHQVISYWIGSYSDTSLSKIAAEDLNNLIDYIIKAGNYGKVNQGLTASNKVAVSNILNKDSFNLVNNAINTFTDTNTGLASKKSGDIASKSDIETFISKMNSAKMPPKTVPCCENTSFQNCITSLRIG